MEFYLTCFREFIFSSAFITSFKYPFRAVVGSIVLYKPEKVYVYTIRISLCQGGNMHFFSAFNLYLNGYIRIHFYNNGIRIVCVLGSKD